MYFKKILLYLFANSFIVTGFSQVVAQYSQGQIVNLNRAIGARIIEEIRIEGVDNNTRIPFSRITGSPFYQDKWQNAALYQNSKLVGILLAKLNVVTGEIHILRNDKELVVEDNITSILFFRENDSSIISSIFNSKVPNLFLYNKKLDDFVQVLNFGNYQLLKYTKRIVSTGDSLFHTLKRYYFSDENYYFLKSGNRVERIKRLNKENVLTLLPSSSVFAEWIKSHHIDFKKEENIIRFLNYYNAQKQ